MYETVSREMMDFVQRSPSCFHAVSELAKMLEQAGFIALQESDAWKLQPGKDYYVTRNGSAVMAFRMPPEKPTGFMIAAAHSDAPTMKLKDIAELSDQNYVRLNVEKYGGAILEPWMDRPLSVAGRVSVQQGSRVFTRLVNIDRDLLLIPHMAIHMDRGMNDGRALNPQIDMLPVYGQASSAGTLKNLIAEAAGVQPEQLLASDLFLYLRQPGSVWGAENEFISSPKLDDLQCAWACTKAICETENKHMIPLCAIFDNEEVGSTTKQGAGSTFMQEVIERICEELGAGAGEKRRMLAASLMASADNGHAIHPNHPEKADKTNRPVMNGGVVIKYSANQKYTTDAVSAGLFKAICAGAGVPVQTFVNRSDVLGGSTLGNISGSHVALNTVDIGLAQLAMHSPYETGGNRDTLHLLNAIKALYAAQLRCTADGDYEVN